MAARYRIVGWTYAGICAFWAYNARPARPRPPAPRQVRVSRVPAPAPRQAVPQPVAPVRSSVSDAEEWFRRAKPYCNAVEVSNVQRDMPAPPSVEGTGFNAACFALAGKIDDARHAIDRLSDGDRQRAAEIVFEIGHPVADAGDDRSAGPIMELVVDYIPSHFMALYHAGMAEYMLGQRDVSKKNLTDFLKYYTVDDGWRSNAVDVLKRLDDPALADPRRPREP